MVRPITAVVMASLLVGAAGSGSAGALPPPGPGTGGAGGGEGAPTSGGGGGGTRHTVTLITGDVVTLTTPAPTSTGTAAGGPATTTAGVVAAPRPGGASVAFRQVRDGDRLLVVPSDAAALVSSGVLDRRLFDVTGLVEAGLTGEQDTRIIVQMTGESLGPGDGSTVRGIARKQDWTSSSR